MTILIVVGLVALWTLVGRILTGLGARPKRDEAGTVLVSIDSPVMTLGRVATLTIRAELPKPLADSQPTVQDVVFVLDRSLSMGTGPGSALDEMIRAVSEFLDTLPESFRCGIVAFDAGAQILAPISSDHQRNRAVVKSLSAGGGTSIAAGLRKAKDALDALSERRPATLVLLTDGGDDTLGEAQTALAELLVAREMSITCVGLGSAANMELLRNIAGDQQVFKLERPDEIKLLFDFLSGRIRGGLAAAVVVECDVEDPAPWRLVEDRDKPTFAENRAGRQLTAKWVRPVIGNEPFSLQIPLEAQCPGWWPALRACRVSWHFDAGRVETSEVGAGPRLLVLPGWMRGIYPVANALLWPFLQRLKCLHAEVATPEPGFEALAPKEFAALAPPGEVPYSPTPTPTLFICVGDAGSRVGDALFRRIYDRDLAEGTAARVDVTVAARDSEQERAPHVVHIAVDARNWVRDAAMNGVPPTRNFVPALEWLASGEVLHTYFGVGENRALARLALLLEPRDLQTAIDAAVTRASAAPPLQVVLIASSEEAAAGALLLEVAHMCAPLSIPCFAVLSASRRMENQRGAEAALARELDRALSCRGEAVWSDRGGIEVSARRFLDAVIIVGDRQFTPERLIDSHVDAVWSLFAYPDFKPFVERATARGCARMLIEARAAPRRRLWEMVRERALSDVVASWATGRGSPAEGWTLTLKRAAESSSAFWAGGAHMPAFPPHFRAIAAPHGTKPGLESGLAADASIRDERNADASFSNYLEAWLQREFNQAGTEIWPVGTCLLALRKIELQLHDSAILYANGTHPANRAISGLAQRYGQSVSRAIAELSKWHEALTGDPWPVEAGPRFETGLCNEARSRAAGLAKAILEELPADATPHIEKRYRAWIDSRAPAIMRSLGFWTHRGPGGDLALQLLGPANQLAGLQNFAMALRLWLDAFESETVGWVDEIAMQKFARPGGAIALGRRAQELGARPPPEQLKADPAFAAVIELTPHSVQDALGVRDVVGENLNYVWPEETHAARIKALYENSSGRSMTRLSGEAVSVLRDPRRALTVLLDLLNGGLTGRPQFKGPQAGTLFARLLRSAPPVDAWPVVSQTPEEFVVALEATDSFAALRTASDWAMWRDVICGLVLDAQAQKAGRG